MDLHGLSDLREGPVRTDQHKDKHDASCRFLAVCVAEVALGVMLWTGSDFALHASYALLPFELSFWIGFALPLGPLLGMARVV